MGHKGTRLGLKLAAFTLVCLAAPALAQKAHLIKGIDATGGLGVISVTVNHRIATIGTTAFFAAYQPAVGVELWRSNGTPGSAVLVKDIAPGPTGSHPTHLTAVGGTLFFAAEAPSVGWSLWKSDGTAQGTVMVANFAPAGALSGRFDLIAANGFAFFIAVGSDPGSWDLWRSDGSAAGTVLVMDHVLTSQGDYPQAMVVEGGALVFQKDGPVPELWRTDGTAAGTAKVTNLPFRGAQLTSVNGDIFLTSPLRKLWVSRGGGSPTSLWSAGEVTEVKAFGGLVFFSTQEGELWRTDGTPGQTSLVTAIGPAPNRYLGALASTPDWLYFAGRSDVGCALFKTDGTTPGTSQVRMFSVHTCPVEPTAVGSSLLFVSGASVWATDGTPAGTVEIKPWTAPLGPYFLVGGPGFSYFRLRGPTEEQVWASDGTPGGTWAVSVTPSRAGASPKLLADVGGVAFYAESGSGLWKSDGTSAGTTLVRALSSTPDRATSLNGMLVFAVGNELWKSDGTHAGTAVVRSFSHLPGVFVNIGNVILFSANAGDGAGVELWKSDGTAAGTSLVKDILAGSGSSSIRELTNVNGTAYFSATQGVLDEYFDPISELWKTDGTPGGTVPVRRVAQGGPKGPREFTPRGYLVGDAGTIAFFQGYDPAHSYELWRTDGTEAGTVLVKDISPLGQSGASQFLKMGDAVFFIANDGINNIALWRTDGTSSGTILVKQVTHSFLVEMDGKLYFTSATGLWKSDGTTAGTVLVHPSGVTDSPPVPLQHRLYFLGSTGRLWTSDGTTSGTNEVGGAPLGFRTPLVTSVDRLFFGAAGWPFSSDEGLWTLSPTDPVVDDLAVVPGPTTTELQAVVLTDGGSPVTERGFLYSETNPTPEVGGPGVTKVAVAGGLGPMSASLTGLTSSTPFFLRAFAATANGVGYDSAMFVTPVINGPALSISDVTMDEGYSGSANAVFTVTLSEPSTETVTVLVLVSDQSATAGSDYLDPGPQTLTFDPGETVKLVEVAVLGDAGLEEDETFLVTLSIPLRATLLDPRGVGRIANDDLASRVFVAHDGSDAAQCWIKTTPCRTIAGALNQTAVDGEVIVVTSGAYATAPLLIDKGVKVTAATGTTALIRQPITINAPTGRVVLRGLTLKGNGTGDAITIAAADSLSIEDTTIDLWANGLQISNAAASQVSIANSVFRANTAGIRDSGGAVGNRISVEDSRFERNTRGIEVLAGSFMIRDSAFIGNTSRGVVVGPGSTTIHRSEFSQNATAVATLSGGTVRLSRSRVFGNTLGLSAAAGSTFESTGRNVVRGNTTNTSGTVTLTPEQ